MSRQISYFLYNISMKKFGIKLKQLRNEKGITQKELADILNVRNTTISAWEKDIAEPPYDTLVELAKIFEVTTDYLLGLEKEKGEFHE